MKPSSTTPTPDQQTAPIHSLLIWSAFLSLFIGMGAAAAVSVVREHVPSAVGRPSTELAATPGWAVPVPSASEVFPITTGGYPQEPSEQPATF